MLDTLVGLCTSASMVAKTRKNYPGTWKSMLTGSKREEGEVHSQAAFTQLVFMGTRITEGKSSRKKCGKMRWEIRVAQPQAL